ncbi:hypothetical protein PanWU01x14_270530, partial [Parasponia andersonii]
EGDDGALEVEGDLHVEVPHPPEHGDGARQAAAPLGPGGAVVEAEEDEGDVLAPAAHGLLQGVPPGRVLERDVGAGVGEELGGDGVAEPDGEVEGGLPVGDVAAVEEGGDLVGQALLYERVGLGVDLSGLGEPREAGDDSGQGGVVAQCDGVMDRAVGVVVWVYSRKRRRRGCRRQLSHLKNK